MKFDTEIFSQFDKKWALLSAGTKENHNSMTISWGGLGTIWNKPVATVYVRPVRYTYEFMNENDYFTVSFYSEDYKKALGVMGSKSGRDTDKDAEAGLTAKEAGNSVTYEEAEVTLLCKKIYYQDMEEDKIPADVLEKLYSEEPVHRLYIGEVVDIL